MQNSELKVLQIIGNLDIGGAQEVVRTLVGYMASDDCQPIVCAFKDGPVRQEIEQLGIPVEILPDRRYSVLALPWFIRDMVRIWRALAQVVKKYEADVAQTHLLYSLDFLVLVLLYTSPLRAVLWTFHNAGFELSKTSLPKYPWLLGPKKFIYRLLYRLASRLISGFVAVSAQVEKAMLEIIGPIGNKVTVICNGVDTQRYQQPIDKSLKKSQLGLAESTRLISLVATLKEQKGHRFLIEAMALFAPRYPDVHVLFIGDGVLRDELELQVKELELENIHFLGDRYDVPELLAASDMFVLPSLWEGLPMALLEALSAGLPTVATEVSGTVQVMIPNETGLLVPPGDVQRLAEAIEQLLADPVKAQALGLAARQRVEAEFSARKQADEHLELYHRLLGK
jgi:glycosyltransferase involved in cell wall biosynthesis